MQKNFLVEFLPAGKAGIPIVKRIGISGSYSPGFAPEFGSRALPWGSYHLIMDYLRDTQITGKDQVIWFFQDGTQPLVPILHADPASV